MKSRPVAPAAPAVALRSLGGEVVVGEEAMPMCAAKTPSSCASSRFCHGVAALLIRVSRHLAERSANGSARLAVLVVAVVAPGSQLCIKAFYLLVRAWPLRAQHPQQARVLRLGGAATSPARGSLGQAQHARHHRRAPRDQLVVQQLRSGVLARRGVLCAPSEPYAHSRRSAQPFRQTLGEGFGDAGSRSSPARWRSSTTLRANAGTTAKARRRPRGSRNRRRVVMAPAGLTKTCKLCMNWEII